MLLKQLPFISTFVFIALSLVLSQSIQAQTTSGLAFDGSDDYVFVHGPGSVSGNFTVEAWIHPTGPTGRSIFSSRNPGDASFELQIRDTGFYVAIGDGLNWMTTSGGANFTITNHQWLHLACVVTPTNYTIYADGYEIGSGTYAASTPLLLDDNHPLKIGAFGGEYFFYSGLMDEVRIWSVARTASQIQNNKNAYFTGAEPGLAVYYRMNEGNGGTVTNAVKVAAGANNGTLVNGVAWGGGVDSMAPIVFPGTALAFNGNSYVNVAPTTSLTNVFTVEAWVYPSNKLGLQSVFSARRPGEYGFDIQLSTNGLHGDIGNGANWITTSADAAFNYSSNQWFHVAYVVTETNYVIYANGNQAGSNSYAISNPLLFDTNHHVRIGAFGAGSQFLKGLVDEVRVWSMARTGEEIRTLMNTPLTGLETGLVAYWPFNEGSGTNVVNLSLNSTAMNEGAFVNAPAWVVSTAPVGFPPTIVTDPVRNLTTNSATLVGHVTANGSDTAAWIEYGSSTNYGTRLPSVNVGSVSATLSNVISIVPYSPYFFRVVATNYLGTNYGVGQVFIQGMQAVNNLADGGSGSLREAISNAPPKGTIRIFANGTLSLTQGQLVIDKDLTILGPGATNLTISGSNQSRIFWCRRQTF